MTIFDDISRRIDMLTDLIGMCTIMIIHETY